MMHPAPHVPPGHYGGTRRKKTGKVLYPLRNRKKQTRFLQKNKIIRKFGR